MIKWYFRNWYNISVGIALVAVLVAIIFWRQITLVQILVLLNFAVINLHFFEEFGWPGGFPMIANTVEKKSDKPSHYPLNQANAAFGNNWFAFFVYLPPVFFPQANWWGLATVLFGFIEIIMHGGVFNILLRSWYNAGLGTSLLGFLPIGVIYLVHVYSGGTIPWWQYLAGLAYPLATYFIVFNWLAVTKLANRNTRFPFTAEEMARFHRFAHSA